MASETVKIYAWDQNSDPLDGVLVRVFDATGTTFIAQNTTALVGADAIAEFTLDGDDPPIQYTIRLSKTGVGFDGALGDQYKTPQLIDIYSPPANSPTGTNDFDVKGETFERPAATDPRLCRCSGFFKDGAGRPLPNLDLFFINQFRPAIVDGNAVLGERSTSRVCRRPPRMMEAHSPGNCMSPTRRPTISSTSSFRWPERCLGLRPPYLWQSVSLLTSYRWSRVQTNANSPEPVTRMWTTRLETRASPLSQSRLTRL